MRIFTVTEIKDILEKHKLWRWHKAGGQRADFSNANLRGADLRGANLCDADLCDADLCDADLRGADLRGADLRGADLRGADLCDADLCDADLRGAKNIDKLIWSTYTSFYPLQCPESGAFVGYKKCRNNLIVKLEICEDALRSSATSRKCRCSKAKVLGIENMDGTPSDVTKIESMWDWSFMYEVGKTVEVDNFDTNRWDECAPGIHFFITREEAVKY